MKKTLAILVLVSVFAGLMSFAASADTYPEITEQPASLMYGEYSVATYSADATGGNLKFEWHIYYDGKDYIFPYETGDWQYGAVEGYGVSPNGKTIYFEGITSDLHCAEVYCVISNSAGSVETNWAMISVNSNTNIVPPPEITVPAFVSCDVGDKVKLTCKVKTANVSEKAGPWLQYEWCRYDHNSLVGGCDTVKSSNGIISDTSFTCTIDTSKPGTFYYVCSVTDGNDPKEANYSNSGMVTVVVNDVDEEEVVGIEITRKPSKLQYEVGEPVDLSGIKVRITTSMGFMDTEDRDMFTVEPVVFTDPGEQDVIVSYQGCSDKYRVTVADNGKTDPDPVPDGETFAITEQPKTVTVREGEEAVFTCASSTGTGYAWVMCDASGGLGNIKEYELNDDYYPVSGSSTGTLRVQASSDMDGYLFYCRITHDGNAVAKTSSAILHVEEGEKDPGGKSDTLLWIFIAVAAAFVGVLAALIVTVRKNRKEKSGAADADTAPDDSAES